MTDETKQQQPEGVAESAPISALSSVPVDEALLAADTPGQDAHTPPQGDFVIEPTNISPEDAGAIETEPAVSQDAAVPQDVVGGEPPPAASDAAEQVTDDAENGDPGTADATVRPQNKSPLGPRSIKIGSQRDGDTTAVTVKATPQSLAPGKDTAAAVHAADAADEAATTPQQNYPPPRLETKITPEIQKEIDAAMGDLALDELMLAGSATATDELEEGAQALGRVLSIRGDSVFVDVGRRNQGVVPIKQFTQLPEIGSTLDTIVSRFDTAEGVYDLVIPDAAVDVAGWDELSEGLVVEAVVTGHNKGGLEVDVNRLRGFMPISQVALHRVENLEEFVGQKFSCVVTETNAERRNLVVSRRAILERERAEAKEGLLASFEVGQMHEGVVTRLQPFGAFVDLGGIDGLVHISQLSWDRVNHPSDVLAEGQKIKVRISKIDPKTGKIGLAYRDTFENPWTTVEQRYKPQTRVTGTVSRLMDFGAFVRLEAGIEGLIHISELSHRRVFRAGDAVSEGQEVDVQILAIDPAAQRISLSLKALEAKPESATRKKNARDDDTPVPTPPMPKNLPKGDLKGGTNRPTGGDKFGLKW